MDLSTAAASLNLVPETNHLVLDQGRISSFGIHLGLDGLVGLITQETHASSSSSSSFRVANRFRMIGHTDTSEVLGQVDYSPLCWKIVLPLASQSGFSSLGIGTT